MPPRRIINIVNFIRYDEPRDPRLDLLKPVVEQMRLLKRYGLPATWLLQFDALVAGPYVSFLKSELPPTHEVGLWLEINRMQCDAAGVPFHGAQGLNWDYAARACLSIGYTPAERERLADVAIARFEAIWGYRPQSVAAWYIDAHTLAYLAERYGILASANCKEQVGTDGYTVWGGPFSGGYYPSRNNALCPAQSVEAQIDLPVFRLLGADPIHQYDLDLGGVQHGVLSLEPVYPRAGGSAAWVRRYLDIVAFAPALGLAYAQAGQENSFGWKAMRKGYRLQVKELARRRAAGELDVACLGETGRWFRETFELTPAQVQVALTDTLGGRRRSIWYHSRRYRANLLLDGDQITLRDLHLFDEAFEEPHLVKPCPGRTMCVTTLPVLDGFGWSTPDARALGEFRVRWADGGSDVLRLSAPVQVTIPDDASLLVRVPVQSDMALVIHFEPEALTLELLDAPSHAVFNLVFKLPNGVGATTLHVAEGQINYAHHGFAYALVSSGHLEQLEKVLVIRSQEVCLQLHFGQES